MKHDSGYAATYMQQLDAIYARPGVRSAAVPPETGAFLHAWVRLTRPGLVVELGTADGVSALWIGAALRANGAGELHTFDLFEQPGRAEAVGAALREAGLDSVVRAHRAASSTGAVDLVRGLGRPVDLLFIDADHRVEAAAADLQAFWPLLGDGACALLHDTNPRASGWDGPRYVIDALLGSPDPTLRAAVLEWPTPEGWGLAAVQKRAAAAPRVLPWPAYLLYQWRTRARFWLGRRGRPRP
jgi:predicted O-methyltransferase YrrM